MSKISVVAGQGGVRERVLAVAERLCSEVGLEKISVRDIASEAKVSLSAVNYHFGSKTGLLEHLVRLRFDEIDAVREPMLKRLEASSRPALREILYALFAPNIFWLFNDPPRLVSSQFLAKALVTPIQEIQKIIDESVSHLSRFVDLLQYCLPSLPRLEIYWRLHFTMGIVRMDMWDLERLRRFSDGLCDTSNMDNVVNRAIDYAEAGFRSFPSVAHGAHLG